MKKAIKLNLLILLAVFCVLSIIPANIQAQGQLEEGIITMKIKDVSADLPEEQLSQIKMMMATTVTKIHFNKDYNVVETSAMGDMNKTIVIDEKKNEKTEAYMDMMGQKIKMVIDKEEMANQVKEQGLNYNIKKVEEEEVEILGYKCTRHNVYETKDSGEDEYILSMWITDKFKFESSNMNMLPSDLKVDGAPMRIEVDQQGMKIMMEVTKIEEKFDKSILDFDKSQYEEKTQEELMKSFGG
jgi:hypothetical protein